VFLGSLGPDDLKHLLTHSQIFWYNSKIGVRPQLPFAPQAPYTATQPPLLYELVLQVLSRLSAPAAFEWVFEQMRKSPFIRTNGEVAAVSLNEVNEIRAFMESSPVVCNDSGAYFLFPLESEIDFFGGLYTRELHFLFKMYDPFPLTCADIPQLAYLRFPRLPTEASFICRTAHCQQKLYGLFGIAPDSVADPPPGLVGSFKTCVPHQAVCFAPAVESSLDLRRLFPEPQLPALSAEEVLSVFANEQRCAELAVDEIVARFAASDLVGERDADAARARIVAELQRSNEWVDLKNGRFCAMGFSLLRKRVAHESFLDLIVTALSMLHVASGSGGPAFPIQLLAQMLKGARFRVTKSQLTSWNDTDRLAVRLGRLAKAGPPFCCSGNCVGLLKFTPGSGQGHLPTDADTVELIERIRGWAFQQMESDSESSDAREIEIPMFGGKEEAEIERWKWPGCKRPDEVVTHVKAQCLPTPKPWVPKTVEAPTFAAVVEELSRAGEHFTFQQAVRRLHKGYGGTEWDCCLDVVRQLSAIKGNPNESIGNDTKS
jgi:hypothetical protein